MTKTYELVQIVKVKTGIESDYGIAKLIGVTRAVVSSWKTERAEANVINTLKLMRAAGISIDDALKLMTEQTHQQEQTKNTLSSFYIM